MRRPPYSRTLAESAGPGRSWFVLVGSDAWATGRTWDDQRHRAFTVCPPGEDPASLDWSAYRNAPLPVALARCGNVDGEQLRTLVEALLSAGAARVFDMLAPGGGLSYEVKL